MGKRAAGARFPIGMGWMFVNKPYNVTTKEFLKKEFTWEREDGLYCRVLDCAVVHLCEAYLAIERGDATGPKEVFAVVCLLQYRPNDYYNFGYKDMDEDMHPYHYNCPERILKLLTPTDNPSAKEWREECWKRLRKRKERPRLQKGKVIQFEEPIPFSSGRRESTFRIEDPRRLWVSDRHGWRYKLSRWVIERLPYRILEDFPA